MHASAGHSRPPQKPRHPFVSADNRPEHHDGLFRVVLITSGSVASIKMPDIVGTLSTDPDMAIQVVATKSSCHFYSQQAIDAAVRASLGLDGMDRDVEVSTTPPKHSTSVSHEPYGVRVWTDADEWSDWKKVGDPILHIELRRWADLVVVAPCSADMLAKIAGGLCDNLATSLLRALSPSTPTIICPAMNTHMYSHPLTAEHLKVVQEKLDYMVLGPQGAGRLACGDEGPGKMTDWREIVSIIQDFAAMYHQRESAKPFRGVRDRAIPSVKSTTPVVTSTAVRPRTPPTPQSNFRNKDHLPSGPPAATRNVLGLPLNAFGLPPRVTPSTSRIPEPTLVPAGYEPVTTRDSSSSAMPPNAEASLLFTGGPFSATSAVAPVSASLDARRPTSPLPFMSYGLHNVSRTSPTPPDVLPRPNGDMPEVFRE